MTAAGVVVYGSFNSPRSYLASRRAELLGRHGLRIDWRAVEGGVHPGSATSSGRFDGVHEEMERVLAGLLPGEDLPYALAGYVPDTGAAIDAYAEAYLAGAAEPIRQLLFEALWLHAFDLADPREVNTLVADARRDGDLHDERSRGQVTGSPGRLSARWAGEWLALGSESLPTLVLEGAACLSGEEAVEWLGTELRCREAEEAAPVS